MRRRREHPERLGSALSRVLRGRAFAETEGPRASRGHGAKEQVSPALALAFRRAVGDVIAAHARPVRFKKGVLLVAAESGVWYTELGFMRSQIAQRLSAELGEAVARVDLKPEGRARMAPTPVFAPDPAPSPGDLRAAIPSLHEDELRGVTEWSRALDDDPELGDAFRRAAIRWRAAHPKD